MIEICIYHVIYRMKLINYNVMTCYLITGRATQTRHVSDVFQYR